MLPLPQPPLQPTTRRVMKRVTYTDDGGYLVTEDVWVEEELPEGGAVEAAAAGGAGAEGAPAPAPAPAPKPRLQPAPATKGKGAPASSSGPQQRTMASFFGKK